MACIENISQLLRKGARSITLSTVQWQHITQTRLCPFLKLKMKKIYLVKIGPFSGFVSWKVSLPEFFENDYNTQIVSGRNYFQRKVGCRQVLTIWDQSKFIQTNFFISGFVWRIKSCFLHFEIIVEIRDFSLLCKLG